MCLTSLVLHLFIIFGLFCVHNSKEVPGSKSRVCLDKSPEQNFGPASSLVSSGAGPGLSVKNHQQNPINRQTIYTQLKI